MRHACRVAAFLLALSPALWPQGAELQPGLALFREGRYQDALQQFRSVSQKYPQNADIFSLIGITETNLGQFSNAESDYGRAIRINPRLESAYKNLGFNLLQQGDVEKAATVLQHATALDPADSYAHYYLLIADLRLGNDSQAVSEQKATGAIIATDADTAFLSAEACLRAHDPGEAIEVIEVVQARSGFSMQQQFNLALKLNEGHQYAETVKIFRKMASDHPDSWMARYDLAVALFENNRNDEALTLLEDLGAQRPSDARIMNLLGATNEALGKLQDALDAYQKAVAADPDNTGNYLDYTRLLMDLDRYDDAASLIRQAIRNSQDDYALDIRLGAIQLMAGKNSDAEQSFQKAIALHPDLTIGYVALAKAYMKEARDQEAFDLLLNARQKLPADFALEYVFGLLSLQLGKENMAFEALGKAETMQPQVVEPHYQLGRLFMQDQNWPKAKAEFEQVIALDPSHAQAYYQLSRIYARTGQLNEARRIQAQAEQLTNSARNAALQAQRQRLSAVQPE